MQILYDFCTYFRFIFFVDFYVFFSFILHSNYYYTFCNKINTTIHFNRKLYRFIYFLSFIVNYGLYSVDSFATVNGFQLIFWHFSPIRFSLKIFSSFIFNWNNQQQQNNRFYTNSYVHLHIWWPKTFVFCHFIEIHCKNIDFSILSEILTGMKLIWFDLQLRHWMLSFFDCNVKMFCKQSIFTSFSAKVNFLIIFFRFDFFFLLFF